MEVASKDHRLCDQGVESEHRLYLSQLNAEAPDLHLMIDAAQELYLPIGPVPGKVPRAVHARAGLIAQ